jgi:hypothetical protein
VFVPLYAEARKAGIRTARLPIRENMPGRGFTIIHFMSLNQTVLSSATTDRVNKPR